MSPCQVPYHRPRIDPVAATAVGIVAAAEVVVVATVAAAGEVVGYDGEPAVALAPERGMTQIWDWAWEQVGSQGKVGWVIAESKNPRQRHDTLRSALREHGGPGG